MIQSQSLSQIKKELEIMRDDIMYDIKQEWNDDKIRMGMQLQFILISIANIDAILSEPDSQIFKSSIKF